MYGNWWWNKHWLVRDAGLIGDVVKCHGQYGEFWLEPNDASGNPSFFWIRCGDTGSGMHSCWQHSYVYLVGVTEPSIGMLPAWDGTKPDIQAAYQAAASKVRKLGGNPYTARLEGHIYYDNDWEIIRLFCFQGIQADGNDWIVIDARVGEATVREDGTAHGDPP